MIIKKLAESNLHLKEKANRIKLVLTDVDGVLTDTGVYYSANGEEMKRYSIRDGMGVERLRHNLSVETGIVTGENSGSVQKRAEKLKIGILYLGVNDKLSALNDILLKNKLQPEEIAFIGDDANDYEIIHEVGLSASPSDALDFIKEKVDYICTVKGGNGAFREFAELIISLRSLM